MVFPNLRSFPFPGIRLMNGKASPLEGMGGRKGTGQLYTHSQYCRLWEAILGTQRREDSSSTQFTAHLRLVIALQCLSTLTTYYECMHRFARQGRMMVMMMKNQTD